jgi:biotin synthase
MINPLIEKAYGVLEGKTLSREEALELSGVSGADVMDLVSLANKVKAKFSMETHVCSIMNAKSGACRENCRYCAQSAHHNAVVEIYDLKTKEEILEQARISHESGIENFGIVTSGTGYPEMNREFELILETIHEIHKKYPQMSVCASLGNLGEETAAALGKAGILHYNINIQVNPEKYSELIADTHSVDERIESIKLLKENGVKVCCGGILGLGETMEDRIEMAFALKELDVDVIPLNVLIPIEGTPLEGQPLLPVSETAKTFALFRLIHPDKIIKFAAGRETRMKDFQGLLMLAGANGILTGGYLTTRGREVSEDAVLMEELEGFYL